MDEMLRKRISDALLDEDSTAIDDELQKEIDDDPEGAQYLQDISVLEQHLRQWGFEEPPKQYWKGFSKRMTPRLGSSALPGEDDPLLPPAPDDPEEIRSLAVLQPPEEEDEIDGLAALAGRSTLPPASSFEDDPSASDDDDNVLDIGALRAEAEKEEEEKAPAKPKKSDKDRAPAAAAASSASAARGEKAAAPSAAAAPQQQSSSTMYAIIGVLVLALCVVGYLAFFSGGGQDGDGQFAQASSVSAEPSAGSSSGGSSHSSPAETPSGEPSGDESSEGEGIDEPAAEEGESEEGEEHAVEESEEGDEESAGGSRRRAARTSTARRPSSRSGSSETASASSEAPTKSAPTAARSTSDESAPTEGGAANDLDQLLAGATDRVKTKRSSSGSGNADAVQAAVGSGESSGGSELPEQPSRSQVRRAMGSVAGQVMACRSLVESQTRVNATVSVASSGSVQNANVSGGSPQVQQCVQRAVRRARFPRFQRSTFTVTYPFILSPPQ